MMRCAFEGLAMFYPEDNEPKENSRITEDHQLVLNGTVSLDDADEEPTPRVKGLIELLNQYFRNKPGQNL